MLMVMTSVRKWSRTATGALGIILICGVAGAFADVLIRSIGASVGDWSWPDLTGVREFLFRWATAVGLAVGVVLACWHILSLLERVATSPIGKSREAVAGFVRRRPFWPQNRFTRWVFEPLGQWSLLKSVLAMLIVAAVLVLSAWWVIRAVLGISDAEPPSMEITKVALTIAGGVGASVALVVAYRKQRDTEANRFVDRFGAAAAQLGGDDPAVRLAGVYAMTTLADDSSKPQWQQQCVDVLCAYLRMPHDIESGKNHLTEQTRGYPAQGNPQVMVTDQFRFRYNDNEVRDTIVRVIIEHLQPGSDFSWSDLRFDFSGAAFSGANFAGCVFGKSVNFERATFFGISNFERVHFKGVTIFNDVKFHDYVSFRGGLGPSGYVRAKFDAPVYFSNAKFFGTATWDQVDFADRVVFGARVSDASRRTEFLSPAMFFEVAFEDAVEFVGVRFHNTFYLHFVKINGPTFFTPQPSPSDLCVAFDGKVDFNDVEFREIANFERAQFASEAEFKECTFKRAAMFKGVVFGKTRFEHPRFERFGNFKGAHFGGTAEFIEPLEWNAVAFDWDDDVSLKPVDVQPASWPPPVVAVPAQ
ncbi:hypothetical protein GS434_17305 [Rhodococcus hoagii]|nr:hypothetical protein [Prescottella equi]